MTLEVEQPLIENIAIKNIIIFLISQVIPFQVRKIEFVIFPDKILNVIFR